jgi:hypothetical protein
MTDILQKKPEYKIKLTKVDGRLQTSSPLTLKNIIKSGDILDIAQIANVTVVDKVDGAVLQYNVDTNKYEVKLGTFDGGEF